MLIESERLGAVEVDEDTVLLFEDGLLGFPDVARYALVDAAEGDTYFWLQAIDDPRLAFLAAVPWAFFPDYEPELGDADQDALGLTSATDAIVLCLLTVTDLAVTANLLGPLVVNAATRRGRQVVLSDPALPVRAPLLPA
ncbi:MAG TPA: flagellar assembly protein FliW [Acidimicrobiales bacterium]|nr:flagellar assembly protein FliW [Acidimicrobiales bacterium]